MKKIILIKINKKMCTSCCRINSLTLNKFNKYSFLINILQISISSIIIFINLLFFIICNKTLMIKTGFLSYINNIFLSLLIISSILLIEFYRKRNNLTKEKKSVSIILICFSMFMSIFKTFSSLIDITKINQIYNFYKSDKDDFTQFKIIFGITLMTLGLYVFSVIILIIYTLLIYRLRLIVFRNDLNNVYHNNGNISYMSTKTDVNDNSQEIIINNLNEGNKKNNNFFFFSQNLINKFEKEYEDKGSQTVAKGNNK